MYTWSICQSNLQVLQRKLQHNPGPDIYTRNTHSATGARGSPQPGFNQVIPLHKRAPSCDVSLTWLTSWRCKPLHQGSSRSAHTAQKYRQYYGRSAPVTHRNRYVALNIGVVPIAGIVHCQTGVLPAMGFTGMARQHPAHRQRERLVNNEDDNSVSVCVCVWRGGGFTIFTRSRC